MNIMPFHSQSVEPFIKDISNASIHVFLFERHEGYIFAYCHDQSKFVPKHKIRFEEDDMNSILS